MTSTTTSSSQLEIGQFRNQKYYINNERGERLCAGECHQVLPFHMFRTWKNRKGISVRKVLCRPCESKYVFLRSQEKKMLHAPHHYRQCDTLSCGYVWSITRRKDKDICPKCEKVTSE